MQGPRILKFPRNGIKDVFCLRDLTTVNESLDTTVPAYLETTVPVHAYLDTAVPATVNAYFDTTVPATVNESLDTTCIQALNSSREWVSVLGHASLLTGFVFVIVMQPAIDCRCSL